MKHLHVNTPLIESTPLSLNAGRKIFLKLENTQPTGSFKIRGIGHLCQHGKKEGKTHFVTSSGGNAGIAAAYSGRKLGIQTTVFVPSTTPQDTIKKIKDQEAEVLVHGDVWDDTNQFALKFAKENNGLYISPFDHPLIWKGHSTIVDEIAKEIDKPDAFVLSVGGGGLLCGVVEGLQKNNFHDVPVIAVETEGAASFAASQKAGKLITLSGIDSIAKTLGAKTVSQQTLKWDKRHFIKSVVVTDQQAITACAAFAKDHRYLVEPACGASLVVPYENHKVLKKAKSIVVIVCGGVGIDLEKLNHWLGI